MQIDETSTSKNLGCKDLSVLIILVTQLKDRHESTHKKS